MFVYGLKPPTSSGLSAWELIQRCGEEGYLYMYLCVHCRSYRVSTVLMQETDEFVRTECYHYFHSSCFARYWQFCIREQEDGGYCKGEEEKQKKVGKGFEAKREWEEEGGREGGLMCSSKFLYCVYNI